MNRDAKGCRVVRLRSLLLASGLLLALVVGTGIWQLPLLREQFRGWWLGQAELAAEKYGRMLEDAVNTVEISEVEAGSRATNLVTLVTGSRTRQVKCGSTQKLFADDAQQFVKRWRSMRFHWGLSGMCHEEAFAIRFHKNNKSVLETTVCFKCQNFEIPFPLGDGFEYMGFDLASPAGQAFLAEVRRRFPDSPKWVEMDKKRQPKPKPGQ